METSQLKPHIAGGVVLGTKDKIVLVEQQGNSWSLPKGGIEEGESPLEAARREIQEETGITTLALVCELGRYRRHSLNREGTGADTTRPARLRVVFLFTTPETNLTIGGTEITASRWVTVDEALTLLTHEADRDFLASARATIEKCLN
ncbi:MAG TPA: NUDIX domain-containing protein [Candidatus Paceibacterota bacterium]